MTQKDFINARLDLYKVIISGFMAGIFLMIIGIFTIDNLSKSDLYILSFFTFVFISGMFYYVKKYEEDMNNLLKAE